MSIFKKAAKYAAARAKEPTTYVGAAMIATALGAGSNVNAILQAIGLIAGGGLVSASEPSVLLKS